MAGRYVAGLVSVIIPTYNRAALLVEAMDSVRAQTYRPIELVIADDGSTDETAEVVRAWGQRHGDRTLSVVYVYQENAGQAAAYNLGLAESHGEYIQFLDSDDYFPPDRLAVVVEAAEETERFQVAVTDFAVVDEHKRTVAMLSPPDITSRRRVRDCIGSPLWTASPFFHRDFVCKVGLFRRGLLTGEDWEYGLRVALSCTPGRCRRICRPLACYRIHPGPRLLTTGRSPERIRKMVMALNEALSRSPAAIRYRAVLARTLLRWFVARDGATPEFLDWALELPCPPCTAIMIRAAKALSRLLGAPKAVRLMRWARRMYARPDSRAREEGRVWAYVSGRAGRPT
jgi:glycosyltransferase involved in cell wall biosynthesis